MLRQVVVTGPEPAVGGGAVQMVVVVVRRVMVVMRVVGVMG